MRPRSRTLARPNAASQRARRRQGGYVGILMAFLAVPIFAMAAFAADVGYWYTDAAKLQRASDAAALAGVIWMPDAGKASIEATKVLKQNGIDTTVDLPDGTDRYIIQIQTPTSERLRVTVTDRSAGRLFSQILDQSDVQIIRTSLAEYIRPIPLGSPSAVYGNDPTDTTFPNFWASIGSPYYTRSGGDPYASKCSEVPPVPPACTAPNLDYRPTGYFYAIEIPAGQSGADLTVQLYDAGNYHVRSDAIRNPARVPAGKPPIDDFSFTLGRTSFQLLDEDSTPLNYEDNPGITYGAANVVNPPDVPARSGKACWAVLDDMSASEYAAWGNLWHNLCTVRVLSNTTTVYPLQVKTSNIPGITPDTGSGLNNFSIKVSLAGGTGPQPRVYAVGQMPVFSNPQAACGANETNFFLAEIGNLAAGKKINISFFDPGDVSGTGAAGNFFFDIIVPQAAGFGGTNQTEPCTGAVAGELAPNCAVNAPRGSATSNITTGCSLQVKWDGAAGIYNNEWIDIQISVPTTYDCQTTGYGCWWKLRYRFNNVVAGTDITDRTTYVVRVSGDPVRVIS